MIDSIKALFFAYTFLEFLYGFRKKFDDMTARNAKHVVVVALA
jgi:hypothetical protein